MVSAFERLMLNVECSGAALPPLFGVVVFVWQKKENGTNRPMGYESYLRFTSTSGRDKWFGVSNFDVTSGDILIRSNSEK